MTWTCSCCSRASRRASAQNRLAQVWQHSWIALVYQLSETNVIAHNALHAARLLPRQICCSRLIECACGLSFRLMHLPFSKLSRCVCWPDLIAGRSFGSPPLALALTLQEHYQQAIVSPPCMSVASHHPAGKLHCPSRGLTAFFSWHSLPHWGWCSARAGSVLARRFSPFSGTHSLIGVGCGGREAKCSIRASRGLNQAVEEGCQEGG